MGFHGVLRLKRVPLAQNFGKFIYPLLERLSPEP